MLVLLSLPETHKKPSISAATEVEAVQRVASNDIEQAGSSHTSLSRLSTRQSVAVKTRKYAALARRIFIDPLEIILYLRFPAVALVVYYASVAFGSLYFLNISVEKTFSGAPYHFSVIIVGLLYIFNSAGYIITSIFGGRWVDYVSPASGTMSVADFNKSSHICPWLFV